MKGIRLLLLVVISASLANCEGPSKIMASWVGHHQSEMYQKNGPPTRVTTDGADGTILIYETYVNTGQTAGQAYNNGYGGVSYTAPQQNGYVRSRMYYLNSKGIIYNWRWQGL